MVSQGSFSLHFSCYKSMILSNGELYNFLSINVSCIFFYTIFGIFLTCFLRVSY